MSVAQGNSFKSYPRSRKGASESRKVRRLNKTLESNTQKIDLAPLEKPFWLQFLTFFYKGSSVFTISLITAVLAVYGWTVYTQELWSQEYRRLEALQRHERELTVNNETLKDHLAQQANNPGTGLITPTTANAIFLPPAPEVPLKQPPSSAAKAQVIPLPNTPMGY